MFPDDLISIGPFTVHAYGLFVALGFLAALTVTTKLAKSEGILPEQVMDMGFIIILFGIIGSRIGYILIKLTYYIQRPFDIIKIWEGGLVFSGGIIGVLLAIGWYAKRHQLSLRKLADLWAPAAALGQAIGRIGCLMMGCCYGKPTQVKWGIVFSNPKCLAPLDIALHPTQIYSSISGFIIFLIVLFVRSKKRFDGQVFLWFLIIHSTARLAIERFRWDDRGSLLGTDISLTQFLTVLILISAVVTLMIVRFKTQEKPPKK